MQPLCTWAEVIFSTDIFWGYCLKGIGFQELTRCCNTAVPISLKLWNTWRHSSQDKEGRKGKTQTIVLYSSCGFQKGRHGFNHSGWGGSPPSGIDHLPTITCEIRVFREQTPKRFPCIFPLQTPTTVDNWWVYWGFSLLSTKKKATQRLTLSL